MMNWVVSFNFSEYIEKTSSCEHQDVSYFENLSFPPLIFNDGCTTDTDAIFSIEVIGVLGS